MGSYCCQSGVIMCLSVCLYTSLYVCTICLCCRACGAAIGVTADGATNAVTHLSASPTAWAKPAKMQNRFALHTVHCQPIL